MAEMPLERFTIELARLAEDSKCEDIVVLDLRGRSSVTDFFVICTGTSDRQMRGTTDALLGHAKKLGMRPYGRTGYRTASWILLDFVDVVVHVFSREHRRYYDLELLWGDAPRLNWARTASA